MRSLLILGLAASLGLAVGAAQAQSGFGGPKPAHTGFKPYEPPKSYEPAKPPKTSEAPPATQDFKPFKPFTGVDTNTAPSGLYPELHHKPKK